MTVAGGQIFHIGWHATREVLALGHGERTAPDWETLAERLIREAQEAGSFDDLPSQGRSLRLDADARAGEMTLAYRVMHNAGFAPGWIEARPFPRSLLDFGVPSGRLRRDGL